MALRAVAGAAVRPPQQHRVPNRRAALLGQDRAADLGVSQQPLPQQQQRGVRGVDGGLAATAPSEPLVQQRTAATDPHQRGATKGWWR
jgi:hypothetical protein